MAPIQRMGRTPPRRLFGVDRLVCGTQDVHRENQIATCQNERKPRSVLLLAGTVTHMTHEELIAKATEHARAFGSDGVLPVKFEEFSKVTLKHAAVVCFGSDTRSDFGAKHLKKLGRLDELSSDTVALKLVGDKAIAFHGLLLLTVGYALLPFVNTESISLQAREVALNKYSKKAERSLTHPLLLNRLHRILQSEGSVISVPPPPIL